MPIYVGYHSADVWANKKQFLLVHSFFLNFNYLNNLDMNFHSKLFLQIKPMLAEQAWFPSSS